jgi:hypothetical protein
MPLAVSRAESAEVIGRGCGATHVLSRANAASGNAYRSVLATRVLVKRTSVIKHPVDLCGGHAVSVCFKGGLT